MENFNTPDKNANSYTEYDPIEELLILLINQDLELADTNNVGKGSRV